MSRIGKQPLTIPAKVQVIFENSQFSAKGPLGELSLPVPEGVNCTIENNEIRFTRIDDQKKHRALHGLTRSLANNVIEGVSKGFAKTLEIVGVGYKAELRGTRLWLSLGYSHPIVVIPPQGISFETPKPTVIIIKGSDKQLVGQIAAVIRDQRGPEPYKGKGIRYEGEFIRRKAGKTSAK